MLYSAFNKGCSSQWWHFQHAAKNLKEISQLTTSFKVAIAQNENLVSTSPNEKIRNINTESRHKLQTTVHLIHVHCLEVTIMLVQGSYTF